MVYKAAKNFCNGVKTVITLIVGLALIIVDLWVAKIT
jgi:hypothetical protein